MTTDGKPNPIIHRRKLFGGVETAQEVHARVAWGGAKCDGCKGPPSIRIQIFVALNDMSLDTRVALEAEIAAGRIRTVPLTNGPGVCVSRAFACAICQPAAERAAARGPSYAVVDIERGPGADIPVVGVTATII